jgi:rubrerythrin
MQVDKFAGVKRHFGLLMLTEGVLDQNPGALHGLSFWVCTSCGYTELFDDDAGQTIKNLDA